MTSVEWSSIWEVFTKKRIVEELIYGSVAGLFLCIGGHPFDTLKTRIQMDNSKFFPTVRNIYLHEGLGGYYKGASAPLVCVPLVNAIIFATYEVTKKALQIWQNKEQLGLFDFGVAGACAGVVSTTIVTPIELVKCKMQMQKKFRKYKNSLVCFVKTINKDGFKGSL